MKKSTGTKLIFVALLAVCSIAFFSCSSFAIPKKLTIKASPEIVASGGECDVQLTDFINEEKLKELMPDSDNLTCYAYKPVATDETMRYLLKFSDEFEVKGLNVENVLDDLVKNDPIYFGYESDNVTPKNLLTIPKIESDINLAKKTISFKDLGTGFGNLIKIPEGTKIPPNTSKAVKFPITLSLCTPSPCFDTVTTKTGSKMDFTFKKLKTTPAGLSKATITSIYFVDCNGNTIESTKNIDLINGTDFVSTLDIGNRVIKSVVDLYILMDVVNTASTDGEFDSTDVTFSSLDVTKMTGCTINSDIEIPGLTKSLTLPFKQAEINSGTIDIDVGAVLPSGGQITQIQADIKQQQDTTPTTFDGFNLSETISPTTGSTKGTINLAPGVGTIPSPNYINSLDIELGGTKSSGNVSITLSLNNSTMEFPYTFSPKVSIKITKLNKVRILDSTLPSEIKTVFNKAYSLESARDCVSIIKGNEVGLRLHVYNTLPCDVKFKPNSTFLRKTQTDSVTFTGATKTIQTKNVTSTNIGYDITESGLTSGKIMKKGSAWVGGETFSDTEGVSILDAKNKPMMDIQLTPDLGADVNGIVTLYDVVPGSTYQCCGFAEVVFDWFSVILPAAGRFPTFKGYFPGENQDDIDLSKFQAFLGSDLKLSEVNCYGYFESDLFASGGVLSGGQLDACIYVEYEDNGTTIKGEFVGNPMATPHGLAPLPIRTIPPVDLYMDADKMVTYKFNPSTSTESFWEDNTTSKHFCRDALNAGPKKFKICYEMQLNNALGGLEVEKSKMGSGTTAQDTTMYFAMFIDVPFKITVKQNPNGYGAIDFKNVIKSINPDSDLVKGKDLFGRSSSGDDTINTAIKFIDNVSIYVDYENSYGIPLTVALLDGTQTSSGSYPFEILATLGNGTGTAKFAVDYDDAVYMTKTIPFNPTKMEVRIPGDTSKDVEVKLNRNKKLKVNIYADIKTNVDYTIDFSKVK